jgi:hypothetical protein
VEERTCFQVREAQEDEHRTCHAGTKSLLEDVEGSSKLVSEKDEISEEAVQVCMQRESVHQGKVKLH